MFFLELAMDFFKKIQKKINKIFYPCCQRENFIVAYYYNDYLIIDV